ncbi:hypothetical protein PR002_g19704 [Phytophthora rubi]|uniref:Uncharacterized protein n=1 Tax=Phytophthora rubi TaxID=129364 RepID=A0A6A3JJ78_9STRA|nr:hypothetical protein PR002_g19704 [Phytophthora rubi]
MITRGTTDQASPTSPSSRADSAPTDRELPPAAAVAPPDVVDVTGTGEPWTTAPARRTTEAAPLRTSKRATSKAVPGEAPSDASKARKKVESAREREIFRESVCFAHLPVLPDANSASLLRSRKDSTGTGAARTGTLTLRLIHVTGISGVKFPSAEEEDTRTTPRPSHLRPVVSVTTAAMMHSNARARSDLVCATRRASLARSMMKLGITLPPDNYPLSRPGEAGPEFSAGYSATESTVRV